MALKMEMPEEKIRKIMKIAPKSRFPWKRRSATTKTRILATYRGFQHAVARRFGDLLQPARRHPPKCWNSLILA